MKRTKNKVMLSLMIAAVPFLINTTSCKKEAPATPATTTGSTTSSTSSTSSTSATTGTTAGTTSGTTAGTTSGTDTTGTTSGSTTAGTTSGSTTAVTTSGSTTAGTTSGTTSGTTTSGITKNAMCNDTICKLPYHILPTFFPSGFYDTGESTVTFGSDDCAGATPGYDYQCLKVSYAFNGGYWGSNFLNDNNWGGKFKINSAAKKITLSLYTNGVANITFNAFGDGKNYGAFETYKTGNDITATYKWIDIEIPLKGLPETFAAPLGIVVDGLDVSLKGKTFDFYIKDLKIE